MEKTSGTKNVLILGSGMMVEPLIDFLLRDPNNRILIGTNMLSAAQKVIAKKQNSNISVEELDILRDEEKLKDMIRRNDLVISYLPPLLHPNIAKVCLSEKKHMLTTSYVSETMKNMADKVKEAGLIFMNEIGLDPGIDHLLTHKAIHEASERGDKIVHYESWCGALCSPEFITSPLLYKFTWAPRGALLALRNNAKQLIDGRIRDFKSDELLINTVNKQFHSCFNFEGYYNRDSLPYKEMYKLDDAKTVIRGTIRYAGYSFIFQSFKYLGFFEDTKIDENIGNWRNHFYYRMLNNEENIQKIKRMENEHFSQKEKEIFITKDDSGKSSLESEAVFYYTLTLLTLSKFPDHYIKAHGFTELFHKLHSALKYLDLYGENNKIKAKLVLDAFAIMMEEKLKLQDWERDLVFMQNEFKLITRHGKSLTRKYDLMVFGGHNNLPYSAVSLLVSLPAATTAQLILDGKIKETGVLRPSSDVVINNVLKAMEKERIYVHEQIDMKAKF